MASASIVDLCAGEVGPHEIEKCCPLTTLMFSMVPDERRQQITDLLAGVPDDEADNAGAVIAWGLGLTADETSDFIKGYDGWGQDDERGVTPAFLTGRAVYNHLYSQGLIDHA